MISDNASAVNVRISLNDGISTRNVFDFAREANGGGMSGVYDFVFYLNPGESLTAVSSDTAAKAIGSVRQVGTTTGELVNPAGFTPQ